MGVAFKVFLRLPLAILRAREQSRSYAVSDASSRPSSGSALAIIFVVGLHLGGRGVLLSQLVAELCHSVSICSGDASRDARSWSSPTADAKRSPDATGSPLLPAALLSFLIHLSDRYFLKYFVSVSAVGIYALGYRFGEILYFAILAFELAYPAVRLRSPQESGCASRLYSRVCTYYFALHGIPLAVRLAARRGDRHDHGAPAVSRGLSRDPVDRRRLLLPGRGGRLEHRHAA